MDKKKKVDDDPPDLSAVLNTALNLILLTLFIYLNSISVMDNRKERAALGSLTGAFGIMPGGISPSKGSTPLPLDSPFLMVETQEDEVVMARIKQFLENIGIRRGMTVNYRLDEIIINFDIDVVFQAGSLKINEKFRDILDELGLLIIKNDYYVRIEGHTDDSKVDSASSKWELSANRAVRILRYLTDKYYLDPDMISAVGFGATRPRVPNNSLVNRAKNRRVEIILMEESL